MHNNTLQVLYRKIWSLKKSVLIDIILSSVIAALMPYIYIIIPAMILNILQSGAGLSRTVVILVVGVLLHSIFLVISYYLDALCMENEDWCNMKEKQLVSEKMMCIDYFSFENGSYDKLIQRYRSDTSLRGGVFRTLLVGTKNILSSVISIVISILLMIYYLHILIAGNIGEFSSPVLFFYITLISLLCLLNFLIYRSNKRCQQKTSSIHNNISDANRIYDFYRDFISDYHTGKEIRLLKEQDYILNNATKNLLGTGLKYQKKIFETTTKNHIVCTILSLLSLYAIYLSVSMSSSSTVIPIGTLTAYISTLTTLITSITQFVEKLGQLKGSGEKMVRLIQILNLPETSNKIPVSNADNKVTIITCDNVSFSYDNKTDVLEDINLKILSGERIAIVGENGSGKTTLVKLLVGLLPPKNGNVAISPNIVSDEDRSTQVGTVTQEHKLFSLPIGENVAVNEDYQPDGVSACLHQADFPESYELTTYIDKDFDKSGIDLSGGERQKLSFARALYKKSNLYIFDEPAASLDPISEMQMYESFNKLGPENTIIYISHRLSSCHFCDRIIVLDGGQIIQEGSHKELLENKNGKYYALWNAQAKYYQEDLSISTADPAFNSER